MWPMKTEMERDFIFKQVHFMVPERGLVLE